jgi:hypothetical protein
MWGFSSEFWSSVVFWATTIAAIAGAVSVASGFIAGFVGYKVSDIVQKQTSVAIAEANARAEAAKQASAEANARAAEANEKAEAERLARVKIEERLAPRQLQDATVHQIVEVFKVDRATAMILHFGDSPEIVRFSNQLAAAVTNAGWRVGVFGAMGGAGFTGVLVGAARGNARAGSIPLAMVTVLKEVGLEAAVFEPFDPADGNALPAMVGPAGAPSASETQIRIFVGAK